MTDLPIRYPRRALRSLSSGRAVHAVHGSKVRGSIDAPATGTAVARGALVVSGWAFDETGPVEGAVLMIADGPVTPVRLELQRDDVGDACPSVPHAGATGFECIVDLRGAAEATAVRIALLVKPTGRGWEEVAAVEVTPSMSIPLKAAGRPRAAFTIVKDEPVMLPIWLDYYGRYFEPDDLYVLDHGTADGSTTGLEQRCRVVPVHRAAAFDHRWLRSTVESFQAFLLASYGTVLFAEVDELVVADPRTYDGLDAYIERLERPAARCAGFNVVHRPEEPPLRLDAPLLGQRRYWHASRDYSKRLLSRVPLRWAEGFHAEFAAPDDPPDPALMLVHLHRIDYDVCLERHRASAARRWNDEDIALGHGAQNRIAEPGEFEQWFRHGPDLDTPGELIPERVRAVL